VTSTCSDDELRRAYHKALLKYHPDINPDQIDATVKTQQLTSAYAELKYYRVEEPQCVDSEDGIKITVDGIEHTIQFSFGQPVDIKDIADRKATLRNEWEEFRQNPSDPILALRLVHAAFRAEQQAFVEDLLLNPILTDSASLLLSFLPEDEASNTLIRWSEVLQHRKRPQPAIQILEDAFATGRALPYVGWALRRLHYSWAQYEDPTTGTRATPDVRIKHLRRILEIGFRDGYIYKFLAKAYHDCGDDEQARVCLRQAYELDPQLSGAVQISRALGLTKSSETSARGAKASKRYRYTRPEQIPSSAQLCEWVREGRWYEILEFANPNDYSPRILPKSREVLRQIASSLEGCTSPNHMIALTPLLNFTYYWDVSGAAMTTLSKIGDDDTIKLLEAFKRPANTRLAAHLEMCISYLRARVNDQDACSIPPRELLAQAEKALAKNDTGRARVILERLLAEVEQTDSIYPQATILLARSCARMDDPTTSIKLIKPVLNRLPERSRGGVLKEVASWLWSDLVFQQYDPSNDENYRLALEIHMELALIARRPDDVLKNLTDLARWLECLGANSIAQWLRRLIRSEAPGTWYVDNENRERYVPNVDLSQYLRAYLSDVDHTVKTTLTAKLKALLESPHTLESSQLFLRDTRD
jgi:tetratricopeptide (TPR) repeat protein